MMSALCRLSTSTLLLMGFLPETGLSAPNTQTNTDLVGKWIAIDDGADPGIEVNISHSATGKMGCVLIVTASHEYEKCDINRSGASLAINGRNALTENYEPTTNHVLLLKIDGDMMRGKMFPSMNAVQLYRHESTTEVQRLEKRAELRRHWSCTIQWSHILSEVPLLVDVLGPTQLMFGGRDIATVGNRLSNGWFMGRIAVTENELSWEQTKEQPFAMIYRASINLDTGVFEGSTRANGEQGVGHGSCTHAR